MRALPSRPSATSANYSVRKPPSSAHPPSPFRRTARPRPARAAGTGTRRTARAKRYSGAGTAISTPTPIGTAAVIIRNRAYVRHCEWQSGHTPDVLTAPTGWREQPSGSEPRQPRLGLELSVFKPEGTATSSHRRQGTRPKVGLPYPNRRPKTPKLRRIQHEDPISGVVLNLSTRSKHATRDVRSGVSSTRPASRAL